MAESDVVRGRPAVPMRKGSGSIIIPRDSPTVEAVDEQYDANDARAMSPRRSNDEVEKLGDDARAALEEQAKALQENLMEIIDRVDTVRSEHEKLEGGNKFLQSYIGELMQTSKMTAAGGRHSSGAAGATAAVSQSTPRSSTSTRDAKSRKL